MWETTYFCSVRCYLHFEETNAKSDAATKSIGRVINKINLINIKPKNTPQWVFAAELSSQFKRLAPWRFVQRIKRTVLTNLNVVTHKELNSVSLLTSLDVATPLGLECVRRFAFLFVWWGHALMWRQMRRRDSSRGMKIQGAAGALWLSDVSCRVMVSQILDTFINFLPKKGKIKQFSWKQVVVLQVRRVFSTYARERKVAWKGPLVFQK